MASLCGQLSRRSALVFHPASARDGGSAARDAARRRGGAERVALVSAGCFSSADGEGAAGMGRAVCARGRVVGGGLRAWPGMLLPSSSSSPSRRAPSELSSRLPPRNPARALA
jgi:hypothetical protein